MFTEDASETESTAGEKTEAETGSKAPLRDISCISRGYSGISYDKFRKKGKEKHKPVTQILESR